MTISLPVVPIAERHIASFRDALDAVAKEKRYLAQIEAPPLERVRGFVMDGIEADVAQFVALDGETVVGWADIFPAWAQAISHRGAVGMGVLPAYRGRGIGTRLLTACIEKALRSGLTRIDLEVRADNEAAITLYERLGFTVEGVKRSAMRFDGEYFDALLMSRLAPEADTRS